MDYDATFAKRGRSYKYAMDTYPHAMDAEFQTAVRVCGLSAGDVLLNIPAACIPLPVPPDVNYLCYETNASFAALTGLPCCSLGAIPLLDGSVDVIVTLASLHHATDEERAAFYTEARRLLKPGGRLLIGDVASGSAQDAWLNQFVDAHNSSGHRGRFWSCSDAGLLSSCGFSVEVSEQSYTWGFPSWEAAIDFSRHLFGLDLATDAQISEGLQRHLSPVRHEGGGVCVPWSLLYFTSIVAPALSPTP